MSEIQVDLVAPSPEATRLPSLGQAQRAVCEASARESLIVRGAPGSGKTTTLLAAAQAALEAGERVAVLVPDRVREKLLAPRLQAVAPHVVRPVRTPASFAYNVVNLWRTRRADPLGDLELITGAQEDAAIAELLAQGVPEWEGVFAPELLEMSMMRMEVRNLLSRADEHAVSAEELDALGQRYAQPAWLGGARLRRALDQRGEADSEVRGTMRASHSRIQHVAADLVRCWEEAAPERQVSEPLPVPDLLIVDDLQDCTPATLALIEAVHSRGARLLAFSDPDIAVASYRGGYANADMVLAAATGCEIRELGEVYRGTPQLRAVVQRVCEGITQQGPIGRRLVGTAPSQDEATAEPPTGDEVRIHVAETRAQMGAQLARHLRAHHLYDGIPWGEQVVIVRSAAAADEIRRQLRRAHVPIENQERAFSFTTEPVTRILLRLLTAAAELGTDSGGLVEELVSSPLIGADPVDVRRLWRILNAEGAFNAGTAGQDAPASVAEVDLAALLTRYRDPEQAQRDVTSYERLSRYAQLCENLTRAARMWRLSAQAARKRPREGLWDLWEAAGVAHTWQEEAVKDTAESFWYDTQLDAILALFRVADVWEQRNPAGDAASFASAIIDQLLPVDTIVDTGQRPAGVPVLSAAQAAGGQWQVVAIAGVQDGLWPNTALRNHMLHADTLGTLMLGIRQGADELSWEELTHVRSRRRAVKDDEYRLFACAASRASRFLHVAVVLNEEAAPSELCDRVALAEDTGTRKVERAEDGRPLYRVEKTAAPLDFHGLMGALRYWAAQEENSDEKEAALTALALLQREGIPGADPVYWGGAGGVTSHAPLFGAEAIRVSPSSVETMEKCPLKWFFRRIGGDARSGFSQSLGTLIHAIAEAHPAGDADTLRAALNEAWPTLARELEPFEERAEREKAEELIEGLVAYLAHLPAGQQVETEFRVRADMGDYIISGSIDRLESGEHGVRVVDFKTGREKSAQEAEEDPQLATYQVALDALGYTVEGAQLQYLRVPDGKRPPVPRHIRGARTQAAFSDEKLADQRRHLQELVTHMRGPTFASVTSSECERCVFVASCPAQGGAERVVN
ncbi:UrvD/REP family ATP-dependent DNA helicase [Schaalia sp. Marseille-Q2122]|uniref:UrvD/REP family ATP-dependent DNA helicase n=1 Tax=Schaalia sp. Marseille-Q2122 TaxID=2736604 RepID=UPI00158D8581|nr:UrvD/REP family ATP-dependent DNA helicase [Schaalia sp. Marseille-Q2122]